MVVGTSNSGSCGERLDEVLDVPRLIGLVPAQCSDCTAGFEHSHPDGALRLGKSLKRKVDICSILKFGSSTLKLQSSCGQRVGEDVVQVSRQPGSFLQDKGFRFEPLLFLHAGDEFLLPPPVSKEVPDQRCDQKRKREA